MKTLVLDAGHGLTTPGKQTMNGSKGVIKEWKMNDNVCNFIEDDLREYDVKIYRTDDRTGKTDIPLQNRVNQCNKYNPDLFISIHHNAGGGTGTEVYYHTNGTAEDKKVANLLAPKLATKTGLRNRGVKTEKWAVLTCKATAILVEGGFMDTKSDYDIITSEEGQRAYAKAVVEMIVEYLNLTKIHQGPSKQQIKTKACERKVKAVCDVNIWDGTDYRNVVGHVKKGEVVYFNEITEDGLFGKLGENQYISLDHNLFFMWDLWLVPIGKIQILISQINAYSGPSYDSKVVDHVHQHEVLEFTKEENGMVLINGIGWVTLDPKMVTRVDLNKVATTYRN